jgi:hypothetical protein
VTRIVVEAAIRATPAAVWEVVSDLAAQPEWMHDAAAVRFVSQATRGTGVIMDCDTRIGPFRLTDRLVVTDWAEGRAIAIRHEGLVGGTGRFSIERAGRGRTRFIWTEDIRFPWWLGGKAAGVVARPVLAFVWRRDLASLAALAEAPAGIQP